MGNREECPDTSTAMKTTQFSVQCQVYVALTSYVICETHGSRENTHLGAINSCRINISPKISDYMSYTYKD